jgi:hypothetical protein
LSANEKIESISIYALPDNFTQAVFDYYTFMSIDIVSENQLITISLPIDSFIEVNAIEMEEDLKEFITFKNGEIFEMSVLECPYFYATKLNPASDFESLKIISSF